MTAWTIKNAEGKVIVIDEDLGNAEEYTMFLNEVAEIDNSGEYVITEATAADHVELAQQEA